MNQLSQKNKLKNKLHLVSLKFIIKRSNLISFLHHKSRFATLHNTYYFIYNFNLSEIENYDDILEKDNQKKITILVDQILETPDINFEQVINNKFELLKERLFINIKYYHKKELQKIKRIPWSRDILEQTKQLATFLLQKYGSINEQLLSTQQMFQCMNGSSELIGSSNYLQQDNLRLGEFNFTQQQSSQTNSTLNKHKQSLISYEEFKRLLLNFSKNSNFKDLISNLQKDFVKNDPNSLEYINQQILQTKKELMLKREENSNLIKNESLDFNLLSTQEPMKKFQNDLIKQENLLLESPDLSQNIREIQVNKFKQNNYFQLFLQNSIFYQQSNVKTLETKYGLEKSIQIKEELNESTKCKSFKDFTPEPQTIKNNKITTEFSVSTDGNNLNLQISNMSSNNTLNQQSYPSNNNLSPNPFSFVNLQKIQSILNQQNQFQSPSNIQQINGLIQTQNSGFNTFNQPQINSFNASNNSLDEHNRNNINNDKINLESFLKQTNNISNSNQSNQLFQQPFFNNFNEPDPLPVTSFLSLLLYYQELQKKQQPSSSPLLLSQPSTQIPQNLLDSSLLNLQNLLYPANQIQEFTLKDLGKKTQQISQFNTHSHSKEGGINNKNNDLSHQQTPLLFQGNQLFQQSQNMNFNYTNNRHDNFSNIVKDVNLNSMKNFQNQNNMASNLNQNPQFYLQVTESQINIMKQKESQSATLSEEIYGKDYKDQEQQENLSKK